MNRRTFLATSAVVGLSASVTFGEEPASFTIVVMDPLAAPLSCPCVQGYAQRDYEKLGKFLEAELKRPVIVAFHESLNAALKKKTNGKADLVIGKRSMVSAEAAKTGLALQPILALSGKDGSTTQTGLVVVAKDDKATSIKDLSEYRIIFGPTDAEEKYTAAVALLKRSGIVLKKETERCEACSDGATSVLDAAKKGEKAATIISSYAAPLLEGCGTIKKGDLRVIGTTEPVPFITAFLNTKLTDAEQSAVRAALEKVAENPLLKLALETRDGFVALDAGKKKTMMPTPQ